MVYSGVENRVFFHEIREFFLFVFVLKCIQREHVYNLNRRKARNRIYSPKKAFF